jgi:hypothetical protein
MELRKPVPVLAGSHAMARLWAQQSELMPDEWYYVSEPYKLRGLRGTVYYVDEPGTWNPRRQLDFSDMLSNRKDVLEVKFVYLKAWYEG